MSAQPTPLTAAAESRAERRRVRRGRALSRQAGQGHGHRSIVHVKRTNGFGPDYVPGPLRRRLHSDVGLGRHDAVLELLHKLLK